MPYAYIFWGEKQLWVGLSGKGLLGGKKGQLLNVSTLFSIISPPLVRMFS